ncbi:MAG: 4-hydroxy-3-methylbut-2-enyl diphosphate reductase [Candidatus Omnitrophica bacterium]|nr:4-hydroxy-3-methylbut-2-enyl diphosphate reductase [Candidatus Omnitrophota bacterium]
MKISVAKSAGFCFGVKRAIDIALDTAKNASSVLMLGDIVHNENVISEINKAGIKKIRTLSSGKGKTLLIRAHGTARSTIEKARNKGYTIVDATCPMVKEIQKKAVQMEKEGYTVIVIGEKKHDEVKGIIGQLSKRPVVIDGPASPFFAKPRKLKKAAVVVQSTQNPETVRAIVKKLAPYAGELLFNDTICNPTKIKQKEARIIPLENDVVIVIGSKASANTKRLYEISRALNPRTHWINSDGELDREWFRGVSSVGITAGASTPDPTIRKVIAAIKVIGGGNLNWSGS